jgi:hypothetical protein
MTSSKNSLGFSVTQGSISFKGAKGKEVTLNGASGILKTGKSGFGFSPVKGPTKSKLPLILNGKGVSNVIPGARYNSQD